MIHIHRSKNKQLYFTITAKNGRVLVTSETYKKKRGIIKGIASLLKNVNEVLEGDMGKLIVDHTIKPRTATGPMILPPRTKTKKSKK
jgi:uncharacterized protein YegP (UPF0339 family)